MPMKARPLARSIAPAARSERSSSGLIAAAGGRLALAASGGPWRNGLGADVAGGGKPALAAGIGLRSKIIGGLAGLGRGGR